MGSVLRSTLINSGKASLGAIKRIYWDACVWISLLNEQPGKMECCLDIIKQAREGKLEIWTSSLNLAEVFKARCDGAALALEQERDRQFEEYIEQPFVEEVQVDHEVGVEARRLEPRTTRPTRTVTG